MQVIIITKDQRGSVTGMIRNLNEQLPKVHRIWVVDKDTDDTVPLLIAYGEKVLNNKKIEGFAAGYCRDLGLTEMGINDTLFLDGDRVPHYLSLELVEAALSQFDATLIRIDKDYRPYFTEIFTELPVWGRFKNDFFTAGVIIRGKMIEKVKNLQGGRLFHPVFDGKWGEEDRYLGDVIYKLGGSCGLCPRSVYLEGGFNKRMNPREYTVQQERRYKLTETLKGN